MDDFRRGLSRAGLGSDLTQVEMEALGSYVCDADLEDELIRALGTATVEQIVDEQGEMRSFRTLQKQPAQQARTTHAQLRRFMGSRGGRVLADLPPHALGYPDPQGVSRLRTVLAEHLRLTLGVEASPDNIMVTSGVSHALNLAAIALRAMTVTTIAVEDPGPQGPIDVLAAAGLDIAPVAVDDAGFRCDRLSPAVRAVFVTPAHQFPLATTMTPGRRRALAEWAARRDGVIVEDDYDAELRYSGHPVASLQSLIPARTLHVGSVSKTLSPGMRLGWIVAPADAIAACLDHRRGTDLGQSVLEQHTLADLIACGAYARCLRSSRRAYKTQRHHVLERLRKLGYARRLDPRVDAGLHVTLVTDSPLTEAEMIRTVRASGLVCEPLSAMYRADATRFGAVVRTIE